jgi:hypothetical protein
MKKIISTLFTAFLIIGIVSSASALTITPLSQEQTSGNQTGNPDVLAAVYAYIGLPNGSLDSLYKQNVGEVLDTGLYASSYVTSFDPAEDPSGATISYVLGMPAITGNPIYLIVKDGNATPSWYLFNLSNIYYPDELDPWNGVDSLFLTGFWPNQGAISHVEILGHSTSVPEPMTLILLGLGLTGMAVVRRFKK